MINFSVTQSGKPLDPSKYTWDESTRTFSTNESNLVLDFSDVDGCTFKTGHYCTFKTLSGCTFKTGFGCTFKTDSGCTFNTGSGCTFTTLSDCTFKTGSKCVVIRRDVFEVHQLVDGETIKLNDWNVPGFVKVVPVPVPSKDEILGKLVEKLKTLSVDDLKKLLV